MQCVGAKINLFKSAILNNKQQTAIAMNHIYIRTSNIYMHLFIPNIYTSKHKSKIITFITFFNLVA